MFVKICGLRTELDVAAAAAAGADAVGFVFTESARRIDVEQARRLIRATPGNVLTVGVFSGIAAVEAREMALRAGVGAIQLHGPYPRAAFQLLGGSRTMLVRATTLTARPDLRVGAYGEDMLLLDAPIAGAGERWDLSLLGKGRPEGHWLLAGGLTPDNVAACIAVARPWGVDVSSGVESHRGVKDHDLIRRFVTAVREASD
jgi:phosphoribosylanthranilate isomerase